MKELSRHELLLLIRAARGAKADPSSLRPANPWTFATPTGKAMQGFIRALDLATAERWEQEAAAELSLAAQAAVQGVTQWTPEVEQEVASKAAHYLRLQGMKRARAENS